MTSKWIRLDCTWLSHPKARAAGRDARDLFVAALCWAGEHETGGIVPADVLPLLIAIAESKGSPSSLAGRLVTARLWHREGESCDSTTCPASSTVSGGYVVHDWWQCQPPASVAEERKAKARKAARARWEHPPDDAPSNAPSITRASPEHRRSNAHSNAPECYVDEDVVTKGSTTRPTDSTGVGSVGQSHESPFMDEALSVATAVAAAQAVGIRDPARWREGARRNIAAEHGAALTARHAERPDEAVYETVAAVLGVPSTHAYRAYRDLTVAP